MRNHEFTDDMGDIAGFRDNPVYEAGCRRMVMAAADWLDTHPGAHIQISQRVVPVPPEAPPGTRSEDILVAAPWEAMLLPHTPDAAELCKAMHDACCAEQGDDAGPSYVMMRACLDHARYIASSGWDDYVAMRRKLHAEGKV